MNLCKIQQLSKIPEDTLSILKNQEILAINQDPIYGIGSLSSTYLRYTVWRFWRIQVSLPSDGEST